MFRLFSLLVLTALLFTCEGNNTAAKNADNKATPPKVPPVAEFSEPVVEFPYTEGQKLHTWVDGLNIRDRPSTNGRRIARVTPSEILTLTGKTSPAESTIVLRGVAYQAPWYEVKTDEQTGWVFGGAIKHKEERKGNAPITEDKFDFPAFGSFDLSQWSEIGTDNDGGGDVDINETSYERNDERLTVSFVDAHDYGYTYEYVLTDLAGNLRKERTFNYSSLERTLTETVIDHLSTPKITYQRKQTIPQEAMPMSGKPLMASGAWTETSPGS